MGVALSVVGAGYGVYGLQYDSLTHKLRVAISGCI